MIADGTKTVELRLLDEKRRQLKVGDDIDFVKRPDERDHIVRRITALRVYATIDDLVASESLQPIGFQKHDGIQEVEQVLSQHYQLADISCFGLVCIELGMLKTEFLYCA